MLLGERAYPWHKFDGQWHAVDFFVGVHPARAFVIADGHALGSGDSSSCMRHSTKTLGSGDVML